MTPKELIHIIRKQRFSIANEKSTQQEIALFFTNNSIEFNREIRLDEKNIIDFMIGSTGIEVKIKGSKKDIYKQICRYAEFDIIKQLVLLTTVSMNLPSVINNKPITIINFSRAWL